MTNIIFHIDVNSAYLSWTAIEHLQKDPSFDIRTIPSIIGGDEKSRHGIVLAKSVSAKKFGIQTGEPVATALRKCPFLHIEPPDHTLYHKRSQELMALLHTYTSDIEQVSIDECYLDFTPICHQFEKKLYPSASVCPEDFDDKIMTARYAARKIADHICSELGFTVNIGIAPNKLLAKMASDFEKPNHIHTLFPEEIPCKMWPLPVNELFMVGRSSADRLVQFGIRTIGELAHTDPVFLQQHFKSHGRTMWEYANGIDDTLLNPYHQEAKGIGNSTTLTQDAKTAFEAKKVLLSLAEQVAFRLRKSHQLAQTVTVEIKYHTFQSCSRQTQLHTPASTSSTLYECACYLFDQLWNGTPIRLLGIRTSKLIPENTPIQLSLFDTMLFSMDSETDTDTSSISPGFKNSSRESVSHSTEAVPEVVLKKTTASICLEKQKKLEQAMDQIRQRYGKDAVMRGTFLEHSNDSST